MPRERLSPVEAEHVGEAVDLLADEEWVALTPEKAAELAPGLAVPVEGKMSLYLLRGVAHGGRPEWVAVRIEPSTRQVSVHQATYDGENLLIVYALRKTEPSPVVVALESAPTRVHPTAELGGDRILWPPRDAWTRWTFPAEGSH